jgi:hypothetical protein
VCHTPFNLVNIRRVAVGCRSLGYLRSHAEAILGKPLTKRTEPVFQPSGKDMELTREAVESITEMVVARLTKRVATKK